MSLPKMGSVRVSGDFSLEQVGIDISAPCTHESNSLDVNTAKNASSRKVEEDKVTQCSEIDSAVFLQCSETDIVPSSCNIFATPLGCQHLVEHVRSLLITLVTPNFLTGLHQSSPLLACMVTLFLCGKSNILLLFCGADIRNTPEKCPLSLWCGILPGSFRSQAWCGDFQFRECIRTRTLFE